MIPSLNQDTQFAVETEENIYYENEQSEVEYLFVLWKILQLSYDRSLKLGWKSSSLFFLLSRLIINEIKTIQKENKSD